MEQLQLEQIQRHHKLDQEEQVLQIQLQDHQYHIQEEVEQVVLMLLLDQVELEEEVEEDKKVLLKHQELQVQITQEVEVEDLRLSAKEDFKLIRFQIIYIYR